jgi:hypothetical protein
MSGVAISWNSTELAGMAAFYGENLVTVHFMEYVSKPTSDKSNRTLVSV